MHTSEQQTSWDAYNRVRASVAYLLKTRMDARPQLHPEAVAEELIAEVFDLCFDLHWPCPHDLWSHRGFKPEANEASPVREPAEPAERKRRLSDPDWTPMDLFQHGWGWFAIMVLVTGVISVVG